MSVLLRRRKPSFPPCQCEICSPSLPIEKKTSPDHQSGSSNSGIEGKAGSPQRHPRRIACDCCTCQRGDTPPGSDLEASGEDSASEDGEDSASEDGEDSASEDSEDSASEGSEDSASAGLAELRAILHQRYASSSSENSDSN